MRCLALKEKISINDEKSNLFGPNVSYPNSCADSNKKELESLEIEGRSYEAFFGLLMELLFLFA